MNQVLIQKCIIVLTLLCVYTILGYYLYYRPSLFCFNSESYFLSIPNNILLQNNNSEYCYIHEIIIFSYNIILIFVFFITVLGIIKNRINSYKIWNYKKELSSNIGVLIFLPCFNESEEEIIKTLESIKNDTYDDCLKTICIVLDGNCNQNTYQALFNIFEIQNEEINTEHNECDIILTCYKDLHVIIIIKNSNTGKKGSFVLLNNILNVGIGDNHVSNENRSSTININIDSNQIYTLNLEEFLDVNNIEWKYILMLDMDTRLCYNTIYNLVHECESDENIIGTCGETLVDNKYENIITYSQSFEYWITHLTLKSMENLLDQVFVLSGCLSLYKREYLCEDIMIKYTKNDDNNVYKGNIYKFGEDRYLTNLLCKNNSEKKITYNENAKCKTIVPKSINKLLNQRKRWTNSLIFCNIYLLINLTKNKILTRLIIIYQLYLIFLFPLLFCGAIYYLATTKLIIQSIIILVSPLIYVIITGKYEFLVECLVFIVLQPFYAVLVPLYSILKIDNFEW
jgi:chitin synthase